MRITVEPIGYVTGTGAIVEDDCWGAGLATIELTPAYGPESLRGLAEFSHLEVLFHFHQIAASAVVTGTRRPRNNPAWPLTGIFAQRGSSRPNRLGSTICRLLRVEGTALQVAGLDALRGTPVLDIKPVMAEFLPRNEVAQPGWSHEVMEDYWGEER